MSVHAAGLAEPKSAYVWENLSAASFETGAAPSFPTKKVTRALREYAIAGALHLDHLAGLRHSPANEGMLDLTSFQLSRSLCMPEGETRAKLDRLLLQHEIEWRSFISSLGPTSFLADWAVEGRP